MIWINFPTTAAAKSLQSCLTLCNPMDGSPPGSTIPGILQARTLTGVGCHFLLQCMKVKSESEVSQLFLTLSNPMECSLPGSSFHGFSRQEYWSGVPLPSLNFPTEDHQKNCTVFCFCLLEVVEAIKTVKITHLIFNSTGNTSYLNLMFGITFKF